MAASTSSGTGSASIGETRRNLILDFVDIPEPFQIFLRIRPLTATEIANGEQPVKYVADERKLTVVPATGNIGHEFTFSKILNANTDQPEVFDATSLSAVQDFRAGQNCMIFSYGIRNSGKTFTMQGTSAEPGIIPRALEWLFQSVSCKMCSTPLGLKLQNGSITKLNSKELANEERMKREVLKDPRFSCSLLMESLSASKWKNSTTSSITLSDVSRQSVASRRSMMELIDDDIVYSVFVSFIEIYNEKVYDLLSPVATSGQQLIRPDLKLQENRDGHVFVKGMLEINVDSVAEALQLLVIGQQNLQVATTRLNYSSSRSHSMYIVKLMRLFNIDNSNEACISQLCFCDLAGSERHSKTESVGHRLKEAGIINSSLLVLGRCITALRHNQMHPNEAPRPIPFRDSKCTRVFQGFFTGLGKALMIVSVSPGESAANETLHVLRFSALAKEVVFQQNSEFLSNPVKISKLSLDFIGQSLDCARSISWVSPRSSSVAGAGQLSSYAYPASDVLLQEDEDDASINYGNEDDNDHDGEKPDEDMQCDGDERAKKMFDVIQVLREVLLKKRTQNRERYLNVREELASEYQKIQEDGQKRTNERIQEEPEDAEKMFRNVQKEASEELLEEHEALKIDYVSESLLEEESEVLVPKAMEVLACDEIARPPFDVCYEKQQTELCVADIEALEEKIVDLEAIVTKLDGTRQCLELDKGESHAQNVELQRQVEQLQNEAAILSARVLLNAANETESVDRTEAIGAKLEIVEHQNANYILQFEEMRTTIRRLLNEVSSLREEVIHSKEQLKVSKKNAEMCQRLKAEREKWRVDKAELQETVKRSKLSALQKKPKNDYQETDSNDYSDFENEPVKGRRKTTRERNRAVKAKKVNSEPVDSSDNSVLPTVPKTSSATRTKPSASTKKVESVLDSSDSSVLSNVPITSNRMRASRTTNRTHTKSSASTSASN